MDQFAFPGRPIDQNLSDDNSLHGGGGGGKKRLRSTSQEEGKKRKKPKKSSNGSSREGGGGGGCGGGGGGYAQDVFFDILIYASDVLLLKKNTTEEGTVLDDFLFFCFFMVDNLYPEKEEKTRHGYLLESLKELKPSSDIYKLYTGLYHLLLQKHPSKQESKKRRIEKKLKESRTVRHQLQQIKNGGLKKFKKMVLHTLRQILEIEQLGRRKGLVRVSNTMLPSLHHFIEQGNLIALAFLEEVDTDEMKRVYNLSIGTKPYPPVLHQSTSTFIRNRGGGGENKATFVENLLNAMQNVGYLYQYAVREDNMDQKLIDSLGTPGCLDMMIMSIPEIITSHHEKKKTKTINPFRQLEMYILKKQIKTPQLHPQKLGAQHAPKFRQVYQKLRVEPQSNQYRLLIDNIVKWDGTFEKFLKSIADYYKKYDEAG